MSLLSVQSIVLQSIVDLKGVEKRAGRRKKTKFLSIPKPGNPDRFFINLASVGNLENFENQISFPLPFINDYTPFFIDVFLSIFAPPCNILSVYQSNPALRMLISTNRGDE